MSKRTIGSPAFTICPSTTSTSLILPPTLEPTCISFVSTVPDSNRDDSLSLLALVYIPVETQPTSTIAIITKMIFLLTSGLLLLLQNTVRSDLEPGFQSFGKRPFG